MKVIRNILIGVLAISILAACETAPIVSPLPNVAAVRTQNAQTQKSISDTRKHIQTSQDIGNQTDDVLVGAKKDIDQVLNQ